MTNSFTVKRAFTIAVAAMTILWSVGVASFVAPSSASATVLVAGDLIRGTSMSTVYYYGSDGQRHPFPNEKTYFSWYSDFSGVRMISDAELAAVNIGSTIVPRPGSRWIKVTSDNRVYAVARNGMRHWIESETVATGLAGSDWGLFVDDFPVSYISSFTDGASLMSAASAYEGALVSSGGSTYLIWGGQKRLVTAAGMTANRFNTAFVLDGTGVNLSAMTAGADVTGLEPIVADAGQMTTSGGSLTVAVGTDNPVSTSIIADSTSGDGAQALINMLSFTVTAGASAQTVTTLRVRRSGISANADISNVYLYEGATRLAEYTSYADGVATFTNTAGLFTVAANSSKTIWVKMDLANGTSSGKTIGLRINAATDIVTSAGATVSGTFPIAGNTMTTAAVSDLGKLTINNTTTFPATIDPGVVDNEVWRFNLVGADQNLSVSRLNLTLVGTVASGDLQNIKLKVNGIQVGSTVQLNASNEATFDLSAAPLTLTSGQTKTVTVHADIIGGTSRAFKFTIRKSSDIMVSDTNYNVSLKPNQTDTLSIIDPDSSGDGTNINSGTLTVTKASDSPNGNVTLNSTNITLAKFNFQAMGEAVKVTTIVVEAVVSEDDQNLNNGKLYVDGGQIGTTVDFDSDATDDTNFTDAATDATDGGGTDDDTSISLGNTFIIPAGQTKVLTLVADTQDGGGATLAASTTIRLSVGGIASTGQVSLSSITTSTADANLLTATSGALSLVANTGLSNATATNPTGVVGAAGARVASMVFTAGTGEAVMLTQIVVGDDPGTATSDFGANFQNLRLMNGSTPLGTTVAAPSSTEGADFTFTISPAVTIPAGQQYVVDAYADILSSAANYTSAEVGLEFVSATASGVTTGSSATGSLSVTDLQSVLIASTGSLTISANSGTPAAGQLVMGETDVTVAMLDFAAGAAEDLRINRIQLTDTTSFGGSMSNIKLYDGTTPVGATISGLSAASNGTATFNLTTQWVIPRNTTKVLTVKVSPSAYPDAVSGGTHTFNIAAASAVDTFGASSGATISETVSSATGTAMDVYRTKVIVGRGASSPTGAASAAANATVLEFTVAANSAYDAVVNTVALTISGSANMNSSGNANLYRSTDLATAIATETYDIITGDNTGSTTTLVDDTSTDTSGIPAGATVRVYDNDTPEYLGAVEIVSITAAGTVTFTPAVGEALDAGDIIYYRPLQPGTGKLYFGAQTTLTANEADQTTALNVTSTDGFSIGDTVAVEGYDSTGQAVTVDSGCVITAFTGTVLTTSACELSNNDTITFDYLSGTVANALVVNHNSVATVRTGLINTSGQTIPAGTTVTFVVKGDTSGAASTNSLTATINAASDFNWDDRTGTGVITDTVTLPLTGSGTLTY